MKTDKLRVAVVTLAPFPNGNVSTLRYTSYMKCFAQNGVFSYVLIYTPTSMAAGVEKVSGVYDGIHYQYATLPTWRSKNPFSRVYYFIKGLCRSMKYLSESDISSVILYGDNPFFVNFVFFLYCKVNHIRYVGDRSELPTLKQRNSWLRHTFYKQKQSFFDGMIVMTHELADYYNHCSRKPNFTFLLPMTIDVTRFDNTKRVPVSKKYIAVVFGTHNRDGLLESMMSYEEYRQKGGTYELHLIGDFYNMPNIDELEIQMNTCRFRDDIIILGKKNSSEVPQSLLNASCLLTTPNYYVSGGFPTKLGEYMLSGVPIVATKAGELLEYVVPNEDMLMVEPGNIKGIAEALLSIENDKNKADKLAKSAYNRVTTVFSAESYYDSLIAFVSGKKLQREG